MKKRILSLLLTVVMVLNMLPMTALATETAGGSGHGSVQVIVENNTANSTDAHSIYWMEGTTPWAGEHVNTMVPLQADSTALSVVVDAITSLGDGHSIYGDAENKTTPTSYIAAIDGLKAGGDYYSGTYGGWMTTLNDWAVNEAMSSFTVANGTLRSGDVVRMVYTVNGAGLASNDKDATKTLSALTVTGGTLTSAFSSGRTAYQLELGEAESLNILLSPAATNKNFLVGIFNGALTVEQAKELAANTWYSDTRLIRGGQQVTVKNGDVLSIVVGAPNWPSMSNGEYGCNAQNTDPYVYQISVVKQAVDPNAAFNAFFTGLSGVATVTNDADYPFGVTADGSALVSSNKGVGSSDAGITLTVQKAAKLTFSYKASSETSFDYLKISRNGTALNSDYSAKANFSGEMTEYVAYTMEVAAGDTVKLTYSKDYSGDKGEDCVYLKGFSVALPNKVIFHANDGTDTTTEQGIFGTAHLTENTFTRAGYRFDGWATEQNGTVAYADGAAITLSGADVNLYAVWTKVWSVTFPNMPEGAAITVKQGETVMPVSDTANTWILPDGSYTYSASLFGYESKTDAAFTVSGADLTIPDTLTGAARTTVTFNVTGAAPGTEITITVYNGENTLMTAKEGSANVYELPAGNYTYTVAAAGYQKVKNQTLTLATGETTKTVDVALIVSNAWDGETITTPAKSGDVYQISSGAELAGFAKLVNDGETGAKGVLTADIVLNEDGELTHPWTPIGATSGSAFTGNLNGKGYTISNLYIDGKDTAVGLFGYIGTGGAVDDLTIEGASVKSTDSSYSGAYAGLVAASNKGAIGGVKLRSSSVSGGSVVGGVAGLNEGSVTGCGNESATVTQNTARNQGVGGIVGQNKGTVSLCYNKAHIVRGHKSTNYAYFGGVIGKNESGATVESCYNHGEVDTAYYVGGIVGSASGTVKYCYNTGKVPSGKKALIGSGYPTEKGCFYLDTCGATDSRGTSKTAEEFKTLAASLGGAFENSSTYPTLKWENPDATYSITLTVKPANAVVTVSGTAALSGTKSEDAEAGTATYTYTGLNKGSYTWSAACDAADTDDYVAQSGAFVISTADVTKQVTLEKKTYDVTFQLTPASAELTLQQGEGDDAVTLTPKTAKDDSGKVVYALPMGSYSYQATAFGYATANGTVTVVKTTGLAQQNITLTQNTAYTLTFTSVPTGATITVEHETGGVQTQQSNAGGTVIYSLVPETYSYKIKLSGHKTVKGTVTIGEEAQSIPVAMQALTAWDGTVATAFADGDGTEDSPYEIESGAELAYLAQQTNAGDKKLTSSTYYILTADIDLNNQDFTPIGNSSSYPFSGHFNGAQHTISNLSVTKDGSNVGLFGRVSGIVENLTLDRAQISGGNKNYGYIGALVGYTTGTIQNCLVKNSTVTGIGGSVGGVIGEASANISCCAVRDTTVRGVDYVGGVVGRTSRSVEKCYAVRVNVTASGDYAGGVLGSTSATYYTLANLFARGSVSGVDYVGGVIGGCESSYSKASLKNAYAVVDVTATNGSYGAVAAKQITTTNTSVFYCTDNTLSGKTKVEGGTGKTLAELKDSEILTALGSEFAIYAADDGIINAGLPYLLNAPAMAKIIPTTLTATTVTWAGKTASWTAVTNAQGYEVVLTKSGAATPVFSGTLDVLTKDFTTDIDLAGTGTYTLSVTALGDGENYGDSTAATAETTFTINSGSVTFAVTPESGKAFATDEPVITLTMSDGKTQQTLTNNEAKVLPLGTYTYTVTAKTFTTLTGSFELTEAGTTISLTMAYSAAWDGETTVEPTQVGGVYQISNGYELAWFRDEVNKGTSTSYALNAKLTDNIDLGGHDWTAISVVTNTSASKGYTGTFDGNGKTISGLKPVGNASSQGAGLFGYVYTGGTVKNVTVAGSMAAVMYSGGVVAILAGGTVSNCVNKMTITLHESCTNGYSIGGVVGYMTNSPDNTATVTACRNEGSITLGSKGRYVGGVVGQASYGIGVVNCANTAAVSSGERTGGVVGSATIPVTACYNTGAVSGAKTDLGGIAGFASKAVTNCYNAGTLTGSKDKVGGIIGNLNSSAYGALVTGCLNSGSVSSSDSTAAAVGALVGTKAKNDTDKTVERSYFLAGTATQAIGANASDADETASVSAEELNSKRLVGLLGGEFATLEGTTTPVLKWQDANAKSVTTFVTAPGDATVTVTDQTAVSGEPGVYVLADGTYSYTVSKPGYTSGTGTVTVEGKSQSVAVILAVETFTVTFDVKTEGAKITVKNASDETVSPTAENSSIYALPNGDYTYTVSKLGCVDATGSFTVSGTALTLDPITLTGAALYTVTLTFTDENDTAVTPATVTVKFGEEMVTANEGSGFVYSLPSGTYTYTIEDSRYYTVTGSFTVEGSTLTVPVKVETNKTWDGTTKTPVTPSTDGVYEIGNAAELAWFAAQVNAGNTGYHAKLTANIYVNYGGSSNTWTPIGSYSKQYTGIFDGNGKKINGLNDALFAYIGTGGMVKNVTVYGSVSGESNVGGICNASYGSFEGCTNYMTVTATGQRVGGIVGVLYAGGHITNCANYGAVTTSHSAYSDGGSAADVGGVVGKSYGAVQNCFNAGEVKASSDSYGSSAVGGIVGELNSAALTHCYNTGKVSAAHRGGGIVGVATGAAAAVTNCYNVGTITVIGAAQNPYCGAVAGELKNSSNVDNCYYLEGCYSYTKGSTTHAEGVGHNEGGGTALTTSKTASEMKLDAFATALSPTDKAFYVDSENINSGYPVLAWQGGRAPTASQDEQDVAADKAALSVTPTTVTSAMQLTLATSGANGSAITWRSDKPAVIANNGTVTLPTDNDTTVTLTATLQKGSVTDTKDFIITVKTRASADLAALNAIKAKLPTNFRVAYEAAGANAADAVRAKLAAAITAAGVTDLTAGDITVTVASVGTTSYGSGTLIAADGAVTYYYAEPAATGTINGDASVHGVTFQLAVSSGAKVTTEESQVRIPWDQAKIKTAMQAGADTLTFDTIKGENTSAGAVTSDLTLPQQLEGYGWALISWESDDESVISVEETGVLQPFTGNVVPDETDREIKLTATFTFNKNNKDDDGEITVTKDITVTVTGAASGYMDTINAALAKFTLSALKYSAGENKDSVIDPNAVTDNIQLPVPRTLGVDGSSNGFKVAYSASVASGDCPVTVNWYSAKVVRPISTEPVEVTLTLTLTKQTGGVLNPSYTGTKSLTIKVSPLDMTEIDAELALLDAAKAAYFDGINDSKNVSKDAVTENLHAFHEVYRNASGQLVWVYNVADATDTGLVPADLEGYDPMAGYGSNWRAFKSSNTGVITHENLLVTQPATDNAKVTITSRLKSYRFGGYYEAFKDKGYSQEILNKFKRLAGEDVSVELTVISAANESAASAAKTQIDNLFPITTSTTKNAVAAAEKAYRDLDSNTKLLVPDAETRISQAWTQYNALASQADQEAKDKAAAKAVDDLINAIGSPVALSDESKITQARKAYDKLTPAQKAYVTKLSKLTDAEAALNALKNAQGYQTQLDKALAYIKTAVDTPAASADTKAEWAILSAARAGCTSVEYMSWYAAYADALAQLLAANNGVFDTTNKYARIVLALGALGQNAQQFKANGRIYDLVTPLTAKTGGVYQAASVGTTSAAFAIIALDSGSYTVSDAAVEDLIRFLLSKQLANGAWGINDSEPDANIDATAMVLTALAAHRSVSGVEDAITKAVTYLAQTLGADGYGSTESNAQVITALSALGIDCTSGEFAKFGSNPLTAMLAQQTAGGGFKHTASSAGENQMSTEQAAYALVAYSRYKSSAKRLYDMSDATDLLPHTTVQLVKDMIDALGAVTDCKRSTYLSLSAIRTAYAQLTDAEKLEVTNYSTYEAAAARFQALLANYRQMCLSELGSFYGQLNAQKFTAQIWSRIQTAYLNGCQTIRNAEYAEQCDQALALAESTITAYVKNSVVQVSFRLIGDFSHGGTTAGHEEYVTWIPTTAYTLASGSTVYDVFTQALSDYGLSQNGASTNYVSAVRAPMVLGGYWLSEMDNGRNSGWMYTVNSVHHNVALQDYVLQDGDVVVWHYVDDYSAEANRYTWLTATDVAPAEYVRRNLNKIVSVSGKGTVQPSLSVNDMGRSVTFTFQAEKGYKVKNVTVDGRAMGAITSYTYSGLTIGSRITVEFVKKDAIDFNDVTPADWFYDDVMFAVENGLFEGTGTRTFSPYASMTRAMLVTVLYRLEGEPAVTGVSTFTDVADTWYTRAVIWAERNNIVNGVGGGLFGVNDSVTREQMATILYRYAAYKSYRTSSSVSLDRYSDLGQITPYAVPAMQWANAEGLISGRTSTTLDALGTANRAEVAAILHRFVENLVK